MNRVLLRQIVGHYKLTPYGALLIAVIVQAIEDAQYRGTDREKRREAVIAQYWLEDRGYTWICEKTHVPYHFIDEVVRLS